MKKLVHRFSRYRGFTQKSTSHPLSTSSCVQSSDSGVDVLNAILDGFSQATSPYDIFGPKVKRQIDVVESFLMCLNNLRLCQTKGDVARQFDIFFKLMYGMDRHLIAIKWGARTFRKFTGGAIQSIDYSDTVKVLRTTFDSVNDVVKNPLASKMRDMFAYCLTQGLLKQVGLELTEEEFSRFEIKNHKAKYSSRVDLCWCAIDVALSVLERVEAYKQTGLFSTLLHGRTAHETWLKKTNELLALQSFTGNLAAHGTSAFQYFAEVAEQIEIGDAIVKSTLSTTGVASTFVRSKLHQLQYLKAVNLTRKAAQSERAAPMSVLVYGRSSVGKSSLTRALFYHYAKTFDLPKNDSFRYVRSSHAKYWDGFTTNQWCIQLDDIASLDSSKTPLDPSLVDVLNIVNNVPYVPDQAALEDKGNTPMRPELVIGTTNSADLNAHDYFACPLAIRRRFPFVVKIEPKAEFLHENNVFLDTGKIRTAEGYPSMWDITVQKVVPKAGKNFNSSKGSKDYAKLEDVAVYSDIEDFLADFSERSLEHKKIQELALATDHYMADISICKKCFRATTCKCDIEHGDLNVQAGETTFDTLRTPVISWCSRNREHVFSKFFNYCRAMFEELLVWLYVRKCLFWFMTITCHFRAFRYVMLKILLPMASGDFQMKVLDTWISKNRNKVLCCTTLLLGTLSAVYLTSLLQSTDSSNKNRKSNSEHLTCSDEDSKPSMPHEPLEVQGSAQSNPEDRLLKEESQNVWYNADVPLMPFDLPKASQSLAGMEPPDAAKLFLRNCVRLEVSHMLDGVPSVRKICGVFVKSNYLLTNNHAFPKGNATYKISLLRASKTIGVTANVVFELHETDIVRWPEKELALVSVRSISPFKDILKFWQEDEGLRISRGVFIRRNELGEPFFGTFRNADLQRSIVVPELNVTLDMYFANQNVMSREGDCGTLIVNLTPRGPMICGLHLLGKSMIVGYQHVSSNDVRKMILSAERKFGAMSLCTEGEPMLNIASTDFKVQSLHAKSNLRYHSSGTANVYGGLSGFRPTPKSHVHLTPRAFEVCEYFDYKIAHAPPVMKGWLPWSNNLIEMINPIINHERELLHTVGKSFLDNILVSLRPGWQDQLMVLEDNSTVNGIPGVKFIDGLNRNTSMGHPWNKSKRAHLIDAPTEKHPDGVDFDTEVWTRVRMIEKMYDRGERVFPVFTACLKDKAVSFEKKKTAQTRSFSSAPVDWSLVVRKYYLSSVKLLQDNKFAFEAAPGTNCMSTEWTAIYSYLTEFGEDKIVAGDYSKFDKKMTADFILEAFWILIELHKLAGAAPHVLHRMWGVATDTAFPLTNFNGDLIEFLGTNPSGHPLTVVINSLVNSLYMRYAYTKLNPSGECASFKDKVHLMTYGDDNIMGVCNSIPWFNHTAIQSQMSVIGVVYTMADKKSETVPYVHIRDCEFLKRKWRWEEQLQMYACPLNISSIMMSLTVCTESKTVCKEDQFVGIITSAHIEFFWHGREVFEHASILFRKLLMDPEYSIYMPNTGLATWDQLIEKFSAD